MIERFRRASIRLQFIALAAIPIPAIILSVIAILPEPFIFKNGAEQKLLAERQAQIELVVGQLRALPPGVDAERIISASAATGLDMAMVPAGDGVTTAERHGNLYTLADGLIRALPADLGPAIVHEGPPDSGYHSLALKVDPARTLLVRLPDDDVSSSFLVLAGGLAAKIIILILSTLLLVLYIGSMITAPLVRFAETAKRLRLDDGEAELFPADGAEELRALATALNEMRVRIRTMVDDRTRMLTAISHDLRTPLTRLRMRVERSRDAATREPMLADIATLTHMIEDSLHYLSSTARAEPLRKVDIASPRPDDRRRVLRSRACRELWRTG